MNAENQITCPNCGSEIPLTQAVAGPLIEKVRTDFQTQVEAERRARENAEADLAKERTDLQTAKAGIEAEIAKGIAAKRPDLEANIRKAVAAEMAAEVKAQEQANTDLRKSLAESQQAQLDALKAQAEAEKKAASVDIEVQKRVLAETAAIREQAIKDAQEGEKAKLAEKDLLIKRLTEQAEELKRRAEQGSQKDQGEVAEIELRDTLTAGFPWDEVGEIKSGVRGADVLQKVKTGANSVAGAILWERKRAQGWVGEWLAKAKEDMRREKADLVVIVSEVVPKGVELFDCCEDVWVVHSSCVVSVAKALRAGLLDTANARRTAEGRKTNAERAYDYLLGPEFVARLKGVAEPFVAMQSDLESERRTMTQRWARRQKQIDRVLEAAFGMRGDIEALVGSEMPELEAIEMKALVAPMTEGEEVSA